MTTTPADAAATPTNIASNAAWVMAHVPGTATAALRDAGLWSLDNPTTLHNKDVWYRTELRGCGPKRLRCAGLATCAEIWLDGNRIAASDSMFEPIETPVELCGSHQLHIVFRSLDKRLAQAKGRRARWRTSLIDDAKLRFMRTTLLGHMPGWCPPVDIVGPWRTIELLPPATQQSNDVTMRSTWSPESGGTLEVEFTMAGAGPLELCCNGEKIACVQKVERYTARLELKDITPWWPHTHGTPALHPVSIIGGDTVHPLGATGFRHITLDKGADGRAFRLSVNDRPVFMRGVCWTPPDLANLAFDERRYRAEFELLRDANINMVRVSGLTYYETPEFYRLADEYGILIWQELPLANFDYPVAEPAFQAAIKNEITHFLRETQASPSLAIICGGSEIWQQASMLGLPETLWKQDDFWHGIAEHICALRDDLFFVGNSPSGGAMPFYVNRGIGHYYGVGAYMRPLDDARRADVQFASECLAFSNVPEAATLTETLPVAAVHHPEWKRGVPRDRSATWDFEDVREHYTALLYGVDPAALRRQDAERYLALSRATTVEVMEAVFAEWRRPSSATGGGLVFLWKDLWPGAGWGIVDLTGRPKSPWWALKRAFRPLQVMLADEGVNGLDVHVVNETAGTQNLKLTLQCLRDGAIPSISGETELCLTPGQTASITATDLFGAFYDANYAYRFGPPSHDVTVARLLCTETQTVIAEAFHFPQSQHAAQPVQAAANITAALIDDDGTPTLCLSCDRLAQSVSIASDAWRPADNYFHLAPDLEKRVRLSPLHIDHDAPCSVSVSALNSSATVSVSAA